jgi:hypothetical protein
LHGEYKQGNGKSPNKGANKRSYNENIQFFYHGPCLILPNEQGKSKAFGKGTGIGSECRLDFNKECHYSKGECVFWGGL